MAIQYALWYLRLHFIVNRNVIFDYCDDDDDDDDKDSILCLMVSINNQYYSTCVGWCVFNICTCTLFARVFLCILNVNAASQRIMGYK